MAKLSLLTPTMGGQLFLFGRFSTSKGSNFEGPKMTIFIDKIGFFRESDPFRFPKRSETVEIVFFDPDLGGLVQQIDKKSIL